VVDLVVDNQPSGRPRLVLAGKLATSQGGPISREQLLRLGVSAGAISYWLASGRLYCVFQGVYLLGHEAMTPKGELMAAVLACGDGVVVSHLSAAHWWGFWRAAPASVHVTVPGRSRKGQRGIRVHLVRNLDARDVTRRHGVPITTPARTLLDLAEVLPLQKLRLAIDEADRRSLFRPNHVRELLQRSPGRRGLKPLSLLLSDLEAEPLLRSDLEATFKKFCADHALPEPVTNTRVSGYEVDAYWPEHKLIVEVDSREFHLNGKAFEDDRRRDADHLAAGYRVMRVTYRQLKLDRRGVAERLRKALLSG
jgi:predicted transcriptional regulator of viral defense system